MKINTKLFGEIEVEENKLLTFDSGIIGFEELKNYMLIHESDKEEKSILWLQSIDEPDLALPVVSPLLFFCEYNPLIEDELLKPLGDMDHESTLVFVTLTVPKDVKEMSVNLKAPLVINAKTRKACQIIVEDEKYAVKHPVYDMLSSLNEKDGD